MLPRPPHPLAYTPRLRQRLLSFYRRFPGGVRKSGSKVPHALASNIQCSFPTLIPPGRGVTFFGGLQRMDTARHCLAFLAAAVSVRTTPIMLFCHVSGGSPAHSVEHRNDPL